MELEQEDRLRNAFAQLLAMGQNQAVPAEALWARQGLDQLKPSLPPQAAAPPVMQGDPRTQGYVTPQAQAAPADPGLNFPTAPAGPRSPEQAPAPRPDPLPFPSAKEITVKPYGLPPSPKKKSKKNKDKS